MDVKNTTNIGTVKIIMLKGEAGNSIASIEKTSETVGSEIYTITLTDGSTTTIEVEKGRGIASIEKTATVGLVDTYTITFTDDTTETFDIINGQSYTVPTDGVIYYAGTDTPEGFEETTPPAGQAVEIDDTAPSAFKTYSSQKIESLSDTIYSTTEKQIGLWVDGNPLYEKTINIGKITSNGEKVYTLGIENVDYLVDVRITPLQRENETNLYTLDNYNPSWSAGSYTSVAMNNDPTVGLKITIYSGYYTSANDIYVTVRYTKTSTP